LDPLLAPETVAVIGASRNPLKVGGSVMVNLRSGGFCGRIVPVNARAESVQGFSAVKSVLEVEGSVDLAVVATHPGTELSGLDPARVAVEPHVRARDA
jgi:acyl-CoA synthetase (NDP forming)